MKLYGSTTSPYVRRLRIWLDGSPFEFFNMDIFDEPQRQVLREKNPILKIPFIEDGEQCIFDSRQIVRYISSKGSDNTSSAYPSETLNWSAENTLSMIDAANDALVNMLVLTRSGYDTNDDTLYFNLHRERLALTFEQLNNKVLAGEFANWDYLSISLYCLIDWALFRSLYHFENYPNLVAFHHMHNHRASVVATDPRG
ncbi:glutathione S-transferase family protein [Flocculibacter collagenilyticus]|uniref:glutathione S-transferase family protein n=1 Tax=Flocculibacter collagenilyticus TaxID=2744479 RepID=UPI0018F6BA3C|nr:glutathione S-transferase family protein [Flocculibacter collagenilyticus]